VIGVDISASMLQQAQQRHAARLGLVQADIERLPFMNNAVDAVVSYRLMAHLPGPVRQTALREMARVTQGPLIINYHLSGTSALWALNRVMRQRGPYPSRRAMCRPRHKLPSAHHSRALLLRSGSYLYALADSWQAGYRLRPTICESRKELPGTHTQ
jgi:ubiquinone/menaquinone biosynthesis C-methylase UbiE